MKITIIACGRLKDKNILNLIDEYLKRISWKTQIIELESKERDEKRMKENEGQLTLSKISDKDFVIALEEKGKELDSVEFSKYVQKLQVNGTSEIKFVIGGASGITQDLRKRANLVLSLGKLTYPHMLARLLLVEQIYRSFTIISGKTYHK